MLNQSIICGRLVQGPKKVELENGKVKVVITVAVTRSYKNVDGVYDTDFINCTLWNGIAENTTEYCKKGDLIGIRGRLQSNEEKLEFIAEKVTFLSSKRNEE